MGYIPPREDKQEGASSGLQAVKVHGHKVRVLEFHPKGDLMLQDSSTQDGTSVEASDPAGFDDEDDVTEISRHKLFLTKNYTDVCVLV